jgi:hypothetical protein
MCWYIKKIEYFDFVKGSGNLIWNVYIKKNCICEKYGIWHGMFFAVQTNWDSSWHGTKSKMIKWIRNLSGIPRQTLGQILFLSEKSGSTDSILLKFIYSSC